MGLKSYFSKNYQGILTEIILMFIILIFSNFIAFMDTDSELPFMGVKMKNLLWMGALLAIPAGIIFHHFNLWMIKKGWMGKRKTKDDNSESEG